MVAYDRRTGKLIGPLSPVYPEDWPFHDPTPSESLWRYMDQFKFEDLLVRRSLWFARADKFKDPFEGRFAPGNHQRPSKTDAAFHAAYNVAYDRQKRAEAHEVHRRCVFISCWHRAAGESQKMWDAYTGSPKSVAVLVRADALYGSVSQAIMKSCVRYDSSTFSRSEVTNNSIYFYKPEDYAFEQEFRMLRTLEGNETVESENPADFGRLVPFDLSVISRIVVHPKADTAFVEKMNALLRESGLGICERSQLAPG